jgi:hypothetical protein
VSWGKSSIRTKESMAHVPATVMGSQTSHSQIIASAASFTPGVTSIGCAFTSVRPKPFNELGVTSEKRGAAKVPSTQRRRDDSSPTRRETDEPCLLILPTNKPESIKDARAFLLLGDRADGLLHRSSLKIGWAGRYDGRL